MTGALGTGGGSRPSVLSEVELYFRGIIDLQEIKIRGLGRVATLRCGLGAETRNG